MGVRQLAWRGLYELLGAGVRRPEWASMNYGYAPAPDAPHLPLQPSDEPDRMCIVHLVKADKLSDSHQPQPHHQRGAAGWSGLGTRRGLP